ncbi:MAG: hypothetical protein JWM99_5144 [Verrucomicrobiales bacterium]|nr:hypothetical protein [Verrucomicrobiales bacterium]
MAGQRSRKQSGGNVPGLARSAVGADYILLTVQFRSVANIHVLLKVIILQLHLVVNFIFFKQLPAKLKIDPEGGFVVKEGGRTFTPSEQR